VSKLPRQAKLFGLVSLLNDFASEMIYPLLPAFVTAVLGGGAVSLGALDGAADFASAFVKYGSGRLADNPRRRGSLVVWGYFVAVVVRPIIAFTGAAWQVVGLRVVDRVGKGVRGPPRDAIIADVTPRALLGRAFGLQRGLDHAGAVLGPLAAWWLLSRHTLEVRGVIAASIVPGVAVLVLAVLAVRSTERRTQTVEKGSVEDGSRREKAVPDASTGPAVPPSSVPSRPLPPALFAISAFYLLRMPEMLIILRIQDLGISVSSVLLLWAALHVVRSSSSFLGGAMSDRFGAAWTMWIGWICYAGVASGLAVESGATAAWVLFLVLGVVAGLTEGPERALVSKLAGGHQGTGFGTYYAATGIAALAGGLLLGVTTARWGAATAFAASAIAGAVVIAAWPLLVRFSPVRP
jgi:MFS family permease